MAERLTDRDYDELDELLLGPEEQDDDDGGILDSSELDGFLTAVVTGPPCSLDVMWPVIWSKRAFRDDAEAARAVTLVTQMQNDIVETFSRRDVAVLENVRGTPDDPFPEVDVHRLP